MSLKKSLKKAEDVKEVKEMAVEGTTDESKNLNEAEAKALKDSEEEVNTNIAVNETLDRGLRLIADIFNIHEDFELAAFDDGKKGVVLTVFNKEYTVTVTVKHPEKMGIKRRDDEEI